MLSSVSSDALAGAGPGSSATSPSSGEVISPSTPSAATSTTTMAMMTPSWGARGEGPGIAGLTVEAKVGVSSGAWYCSA